MSRDRRGNGAQVVGGSNPPCPTNQTSTPRKAGRGTLLLSDEPVPRVDGVSLPAGRRGGGGGACARLRRRQEDRPAGQLSVRLRGHAASGKFSAVTARPHDDERLLSLLRPAPDRAGAVREVLRLHVPCRGGRRQSAGLV